MLKLVICSALALALGCATAHAQSTGTDGRVAIKVADLNLASPAGRAALKARVAAGVATFCGSEPSLGDLAGQAAYKACVKDATDRTMLKANEAMAMRSPQSAVGLRPRVP